MAVTDLARHFINKSHYLGTGAGKLAKLFKVSKADIYKAKEEARAVIHGSQMSELQNIIADQEDVLAKYVGSKTSDEGEGVIRQYQTVRPLTPEEIEVISGVDNINTYVARVWDKLQTNGMWTYSIDIRYKIKDFYSRQELDIKIKEIFDNVAILEFEDTDIIMSEKALMIALSDDHAGAVNDTNIFNSPKYDVAEYSKRLLSIVDKVRSLGHYFDEIHIISDGDQLNSWSQETTRKGHIVKSLSNKEQFDIYTKGRMAFYDALFTSKLANKYVIHEMNNSNHCGLGMSYMANKFLELYVTQRFTKVKFDGVDAPISHFEYGNHVIIFAHGKDEKFMRVPLPYNLTDKADLFIYNYAEKSGYSPVKSFITFYKGDLHVYGSQRGKFGRYINLPSVVGSLDYGDLNFGSSYPGAVLEIFDKEENDIDTKVIWF